MFAWELLEISVLILKVYIYISISCLPFILYHSFVESRYKPNSDYYPKKEWYHLLKVLWARPAVTKFQKIFSNAIKNERDTILEEPRKLTSFMRSDSQIIIGDDNVGNSIYLRITLRERRLVETCVQIRLNNGQIFQLPQHPIILISSIPDRKWQGGGLELTILEPFSLLQINYNGLLRNAIRNNEFEDEGQVIHCKFNFLWKAVSEVKFFPQDVPSSELAEAVANEPWKDAKWIKLLGFHTGFDQYGHLQGHLTYSTPNTSNNIYSHITLNLTSHRRRIWGPSQAGSLHRMLTLFGVDNEGAAFNIGVISLAKGCKEIHVGSMTRSKKDISFIEKCDISLPNFFEDGIIPGAFSFTFKANGQQFNCTTFTDKNSMTCLKNEEINGYNNILIKTKYMINGDEASGYGVFWYKYKGKGIDYPPYIIRPGILTIQNENKFISNLNASECRSICLAGEKATNISLIKAIPTNLFSTLDGFCILTNAMKKFMEKNVEIKNAILQLNDFCTKNTMDHLKECCLRIQNLILNHPLPQYIEDLIIEELTILKFRSNAQQIDENYCWTVRSSVPLNISSTDCVYFDCFTDKDVLYAIKKCWQNVYQYEEVLKRRNYGLPMILDVGVVVQPTLQADISGYLTTVNEENADPSIIEINGNYGLGICLDSNSDKAVLNRTWDNHIHLLSTKIGNKTQQIIIGNKGLTKIDNKNNNKFCLTKEQVIKLGTAGVEIEKYLGNPQKINWTFYKDQLYIISTSKINIKIQNNMNTDLLNEKQIIFNSADNIFNTSNSCTNLTKSVSVKYLDESLVRIYDGKNSNRGGLRKILIKDGYIACNIYETILRYPDECMNEELKINEIILNGLHFISKDMNNKALKTNKNNTIHTIFNWCRYLNSCWNSQEYTEEISILSQAIILKADTKQSAFDLFKMIKRNLHLLKHIIYLNSCVKQSNIVYQKIYLNLLHENPSKITQEEMLHFLSYYSRDNIYNISSIIEYLVVMLRRENLKEKFENLDPKYAIEFLINNSENCYKVFENIMQIIQNIGLNTVNFTSDIWENNTYAIIRIIQKKLLDHDVNRRCILTQKENVMKSKFGRWLDNRLKRSFHKCAISQNALYHIINKFRHSFDELGHKLYEEGTLPDPKLIHHLRIDEIQQILQQHSAHLIDKAIEHSIIYKNTVLNSNENIMKSTSFERIVGRAVVQGSVKGKICILQKLSDVDNIEIGDILVTKCLDIAWAPYFVLISGLICESGSPISDGAISIHKHKIPCILAENATKIFQNGQQVHIMGNTGVIEKISL